MKKRFIIICLLFLANFFSSAKASTVLDIQEEDLHHTVSSVAASTPSSPLVNKPNLYDDIPGTKLDRVFRWSIGIWTYVEAITDTSLSFLTVAGATCAELASCTDDPENPWSFSSLGRKMALSAAIVQVVKQTAGYAINKRKESLRKLWIERRGIDPTVTMPVDSTN
jgi:hypothetical protein